MSLRDLKNNLIVNPCLAPAAVVATAHGSWIDLQGQKSAMAVFLSGVWTDGTHTPTLEDADASDKSDVATVDPSLVEGAFTAVTSNAAPNATQKVGYKGLKRYLRVSSVVSGATTGLVCAAAIVTEPLAKPAP